MARIKKTWHLLPHDETKINDLAGQLKIPPVVAQLLLNRGVTETEAAKLFLQAPLSGLREPESLPGINEAAARLHAAAKQQRAICVYGDYDVDGVTGTTILVTLLQKLNAKVQWHVPHRLEDGYGLNVKALQHLAESGISLVVTVDCGIASLEEAEEAKRLGIELIITDHHEFKESLPDADVLVHPRLPETDYPFGGLSGAGVALKLAWAVGKLASGSDKVTPELREVLLDAVAFAAMGAVADVMPLLDENRILVRHGLSRMKNTPNAGLQALLQAARLEEKPKLVASDVGFTLAPRLNAAGRIASARTAVELLLTDSPHDADDLARTLNELNVQRQQMERRITWEAREMIERSGHLEKAALVLAHSKWHPGLIGIAAGRLSDSYGRPALIIAMPDGAELAVGSGRSVPGFKLHEALDACSEYLVSHGGHAAAAGFKLRPTALEPFRDKFVSIVSEHFSGTLPKPRLTIDAEIPLSILKTHLVESLDRLEPYGAANPQPLFLTGDLEVVGEPRKVGDDRHLSFRVRQGDKKLRAIAFNMGDRAVEIMSAGGRCCVVYTPRINEWQGWTNVELLVRDFQAGPQATLD